MDYYDDQKFDLGEEDFNDILEQDVFRPISASNMESSYMDTGSLYIEGLGCEDSSEADWLGGCLLDDPVVLNDRMISEAFHPAPITNEHSYSSMSNDSGMSSCDSSDDCATVSPAAATGTGGGTSDGVTCKPAVTTLVSGSSKMEHDSDNTDDDDDNSAMDYDHDKDLLHRAVCSIKEEEPDDNNSPAITTPNNSSSLPTTTSVAFTTTPTATLHAQQQQQQHTNHHRQAAIILTSTTVPATHQLHQQQHTNNNSNTANNNAPTAQQPYIKREPTTAHPQHHPQSLIVQPNIMVKVEPPVDTDYYDQPAGSPDSMMMPPTPPSSSTSDSEGGGYSPRRASPSSPLRITTPIHTHHHPTHHQYRINTTTVRQAPYATTNNHHTHTTTQPLFTNPIPQSGVLILSEEEKRTLITEGYPIPTKLPLTKQEERNLKKIRRKIKNKISAQESRRKKKEYVETLEKKMEAYSNENCDLRKKVDTLESNNRNLLSQLQKLQAIINGKIGKSVLNPQASTCVMVLVLCFAVFLGPWSPGELRLGSTHQSSLSVGSIAVGGGINGVHEYDGHVESSVSQDALYGPQSQDAYTTPNMRSRMLMSVIEEHGSDDLNFHQHDAQHASVIDPQKPSPDDTLSSSTLYFTGHDMSSSQDKLDVYVPGNNHDDRQSNSTDNDDRSSGHPGWSQDAAASAVVLDATVGAANATPPRIVSLDTRHIDGAHA